jgi:hypothetical protein
VALDACGCDERLDVPCVVHRRGAVGGEGAEGEEGGEPEAAEVGPINNVADIIAD